LQIGNCKLEISRERWTRGWLAGVFCGPSPAPLPSDAGEGKILVGAITQGGGPPALRYGAAGWYAAPFQGFGEWPCGRGPEHLRLREARSLGPLPASPERSLILGRSAAGAAGSRRPGDCRCPHGFSGERRAGSRAAARQIRNPKAEIRRKSEIRNPKSGGKRHRSARRSSSPLASGNVLSVRQKTRGRAEWEALRRLTR